MNARNGNHEAVRAFAKAPSGKTYPVEVVKKDGVFTANFTPSETGDWLISILHGNDHIPESPFRVRVREPSRGVNVRGLEDKMLGRLANFSIETSGPTDGDLTVDITYNGRIIPAKIEGEGPNRFHISFSPVGSGTYIIRVYFSGVEVQGSPYTMEVIDANDVIASGDALSSAEISRRASFFLNLGINGSGNDVKAVITSPRGLEVPVAILDNRNGNVAVEFIPTEVGEHQIDVFYFGKPIARSPFHCQVFDRTKINVLNLPNTGFIGKPVEFDIDASLAGSGNIEITVNDGMVTCNVEKRGSRQFVASFVPVEAIPHYIQMRFNDLDIPGSPWKIDVRNPAVVTVDTRAVQLVPVGILSEFEVHTGTIYGDIQVNITSPSNRTVRANVFNLRNGFYRVEFLPMEGGSHLIEVLYDGALVPGSPFVSKAYDTSAISVSPVNVGVVGIPVEFSIDVSRAGEGQLEIMVNRGMVPNNVRMIDKTHFMVSFVPREPTPHVVEIKFNGEPIPQGLITIPIMDASGRATVMSHSNGHREVAVNNQQSFFQFNRGQMYSEADLEVTVTSPTGELVPAKIVLQPDGDYKVEYSSRFTGRHTVEITHLGVAIMGSPFFVEIYDPSKIRVEGSRKGIVGRRMEFDIIRHLAGKAELKLEITGPRGNPIRYDMYTIAKGEHVVYTPREPGIYKIDITYGGLEVPGCPIKQEITDNSLVNADGDGLFRAFEDQVASFYVETGGQRGDLVVQVEGPNSISKCNIDQEAGGRYKVSYTPVEVGTFNVHVRWNGQEIVGSPFHPRVVNPRKVTIVGGWASLLDANNQMQLRLNQVKTIEVDCNHAGQGHLTAELVGPSGNIPVDISSRGRDRYAISFMPTVEGDYYLRIMWNGILLERCPVFGVCRSSWNGPPAASTAQQPRQQAQANSGDMVDHRYEKKTVTQVTQSSNNNAGGAVEHPYSMDKVVMTGMGLQHAIVNQLAEFFIDGSNAGEGSPTARLSGNNLDIPVDCRMVHGQNFKYRCTYTPRVAGSYLLYVSWADREVIGSPYRVNVIRGTADPQKVVFSGESLRVGGIVGQEISTMIDTRRAGPGELTAQCMGPTKPDICDLRDHRNGTFTLTIKPLEAGKHILQVKYNGEHVLGSPFTLKIAGVPDPSKVKVSGPGILDGYLHNYQSHFYVDTHGAGGGELTVKIRGPKAAFRIEMQRKSERDRRIVCRYEPTEPGFYYVFVRWSGVDVPGSPFRVQLLDASEE